MQLNLTALLLTVAAAHAFEFEAGQEITSYIGRAEEIVPADLDDDGDPDLVLETGNARSVLLFENQGEGRLEQSASWEATDGGRIHGIADFDSDGLPDLLLGSAPSVAEESELKILFGSGLEGYGPRQTVLGSFPEHTLRVEVADVDASGKPDIILGDRAFIDPGRDQALEVVLAHAEFVYNPGAPRWADINDDGLPDVLIPQESRIYFEHNEGGGEFSGMFPMSWDSSSGIQDVRVEDIQFVEDDRLPNGQGFIVVLTDMNTEDQRVSLVAHGQDGLTELHSRPIGHASETEGRSFMGFTQAPGKPLLTSVAEWNLLPILPDYPFSSTRGSVIEIGLAFRHGKPVLVTTPRLAFPQVAGPMVHADLTGDGIDDLVVSASRSLDTGSGELRCFTGKRKGGFASKPGALTAPATDDIATHVTDFDGDGDQDLVGQGCSLEDYSTEVVLWENLGTGNFRRRPILSGLYYAEIVSIADRNGDSRPDLLVSGVAWKTKKGTGESTLLLSLSGKGAKRKSLTLHREAGNGSFDQVRTGDWDGDGIEDLLISAPSDGQGSTLPVSWLKGLPGNRFGAPQPLGEGFGEVLQDMDGDGDLDLVPSRRQFHSGVQSGWRENTGAGNLPVFHEFPEIAVAEGIQNIFSAEADLNGDGRIDLLAVRDTTEGPYCRPVIVGAGVTFTVLPEFPSGEPWFHDMDGDGDRDVVLSTYPGPLSIIRGIALLENTGGATFSAPTVVDGVSLGNWHPLLAGDLDGDDKTDIVGSSLSGRPRIEWFKAE